jgi:hypothetical protein
MSSQVANRDAQQVAGSAIQISGRTLNIQTYLDAVRAKYKSGQATEHSYRPALEILLESAGDGLQAINEPRRVACGAPDFVITRKGIDIGHCEAKDLHIDLAKLKDANLDQKKRYLKALPNLIYTNGLDFEFYRSGEKLRSISIGALSGGKIEAIPDNFETLANQLRSFASEQPQSITSAKKLAEMMAGKAILIKDIMGNALRVDAHLRTELTDQYAAFKAHLIHDIDPDEFADIYAETIAYGLFAARLHDTSLNSFDRREALELLPKSNPFLRSLFAYIAGVDLDDRIAWVIDELCDVLRACNLHLLMQDFGKWTARNDPFLHFYETFLAEYNPAKRKARGVWYTPEPVVNFIVRAVDDVLQTEFGLPLGLADTSKITVDWDTGQTDKKGNRTTIKKEVHRVQILDPATGTGTFLAEAIKQIAAKVKGVAPGMWSDYVEKDLIPRIHGFELLMASYAMCHMKIDMMLADLGYVPSSAPPRLSVYLTNSLEEGDAADQQLPFARWLSEEAKGANTIKRDTPIMCVIGNPPYSGESANKGDWITELVGAYKREPGGKSKLEEHQTRWISDDYVKFIRFAEHMIEKNGSGVVGFITNHGYLDNPTFRGMRWHLLNTFDQIYVLDLHGNAKKGEMSPDGTPDKNVFDIQQGVAIIIAVKRPIGKLNEKLAEIRFGELWGDRESKYENLFSHKISEICDTMLPQKFPELPFVLRDYDSQDEYDKGFSIGKLFVINSTGILTARDDLTVDFDRQNLWNRMLDISKSPIEDMRIKYAVGEDSKSWKLSSAKFDLQENISQDLIISLAYRPFDNRWTLYTGNTGGIHFFPGHKIMGHFVRHANLGLGYTRKIEGGRSFADALAFDAPITLHSLSIKEVNSLAPLYLYPEPGSLDTERRVNFDPKIYAAIRAAAGLSGADGDELRVFDYIYGVLHSPDYRATYAQFLKIDFPRIPYPASPEVFAHVADKGGRLRRLHLMEDAAIGDTPYPFLGNGDGVVVKPEFIGGKVQINPDQYFDGVPEIAWNFHIGGYQPAQKWLKDRKGRTLGFDDVRHYQKIIKILGETDRIMKEIVLPLA